MAMFDSVLIVCTGNICRSPTGEHLLKALVADMGLKVTSAGLAALEGHEADTKAATVANEHGVDLSGHVARQINSSLVAENSLILVMEQHHFDELCRRYPQARGKTFLITKWVADEDIPDPYKKSPEVFEHVFKLLEKACRSWVNYL